MAEMKNICGKIPMELHTRVRQEIEQREISTQQFIQQVIEEHFTEKGGQISMAVRTVAVQVSEELFARFKAAVAKKGCRQKDFLIALIEKAIEEIEAEDEAGKEGETPEQETETEPAEPEEESVTEQEEAEETEGTEEIEEPIEAEPEEPEKTAETVEAGESESGDLAETESERAETETEETLEAEIA